jgi:hypothetical protein
MIITFKIKIVFIFLSFIQNTTFRCQIWGFHGGDYEEWCLLGSYAVW